MISMLLSEAAKTVGSTLSGEDVVFSGCSSDSRTIERGNLFIALKGKYLMLLQILGKEVKPI